MEKATLVSQGQWERVEQALRFLHDQNYYHLLPEDFSIDRDSERLQ